MRLILSFIRAFAFNSQSASVTQKVPQIYFPKKKKTQNEIIMLFSKEERFFNPGHPNLNLTSYFLKWRSKKINYVSNLPQNTHTHRD